jgi:ABC-type sugar transport system ATPase subunit
LPTEDRTVSKRRVRRVSASAIRERTTQARAIVYEPRVLLFDEPLSNLDARLREQMRVEALVMSDRVVVMNTGVIQQIGDPQTISTSRLTTTSNYRRSRRCFLPSTPITVFA